MDRLRMLGAAEIAARLGVATSTVSTWIRRRRMPQPTHKLSCGPVWIGPAIEDWIAERLSDRSARAKVADLEGLEDLEDLEVFGVAEIASELDVSRSAVSNWIAAKIIPAPDARLACGPIWLGEDLWDWIEDRRYMLRDPPGGGYRGESARDRALRLMGEGGGWGSRADPS